MFYFSPKNFYVDNFLQLDFSKFDTEEALGKILEKKCNSALDLFEKECAFGLDLGPKFVATKQ